MMEKDNLRKADVFSGGIIFLFGLWIILQALKMPMKDSWGGVQNVWFVSPALFPLLVGGVIMLLGGLLVRTALKTIGFEALAQVFRWFGSPELALFMKAPKNIRFYAIAVLFLSFVYLNIPRTDFFLSSILFLTVFINMFYLDDDALLMKMFVFYLWGTFVTIIYFAFGIPNLLASVLPYPSDWPALILSIAFLGYAWKLTRKEKLLQRKFRISLVLSLSAPFLICPIFKYLLLVPMPVEGMVVAIMDIVRYWEF